MLRESKAMETAELPSTKRSIRAEIQRETARFEAKGRVIEHQPTLDSPRLFGSWPEGYNPVEDAFSPEELGVSYDMPHWKDQYVKTA